MYSLLPLHRANKCNDHHEFKATIEVTHDVFFKLTINMKIAESIEGKNHTSAVNYLCSARLNGILQNFRQR